MNFNDKNIVKRNFCCEIKEAEFTSLTFTLFNKIDDEYYIHNIEQLDNAKYSIDDFEQYKFKLHKKDVFLIKMHNKSILKDIDKLTAYFKIEPRIKIVINYDDGELIIIKLKKINIF